MWDQVEALCLFYVSLVLTAALRSPKPQDKVRILGGMPFLNYLHFLVDIVYSRCYSHNISSKEQLMIYLLYKTRVRHSLTWKLVNSETGGFFGSYRTAKSAQRDALRHNVKAVRTKSIDGRGLVLA